MIKLIKFDEVHSIYILGTVGTVRIVLEIKLGVQTM